MFGGPAICLWFSAHLSHLEVAWITYEMFSEGTNVDSAVTFPDTFHTFPWLSLTHGHQALSVHCSRMNGQLVPIRREGTRARAHRERRPLPKQGLLWALLRCTPLNLTWLQFFAALCLVTQQIWTSLVDWFLPLMPYCVHVGQGRAVLGTPKQVCCERLKFKGSIKWAICASLNVLHSKSLDFIIFTLKYTVC